MKFADLSAQERALLQGVQARIGRAHLRHRLALEGEAEARVFRRGTHFPHLENWFAMPRMLALVLAMLGLRRLGRRNTLRIAHKRSEIALERLPPGFDGFRLLHLSDLHLDASERYLERLIERVRGLEHDCCVLTGDFRFRVCGPHEPAMRALEQLRPALGPAVYAVLGNHDSVRMVPTMEALDIRVLMNESAPIRRGDDALYLAGIDDAHYFHAHGLHKAADGIPPGACSVLLSHTPEPYRHAAHCGFDLMLCGHTHGGQICLPGGIPILTDSDAPRAYARGAWRFAAMQGYTSVGCGSSIVEARLNCAPEVCVHRLVRGAPAGQ